MDLSIFETAGVLIGALGGLEFIKYLLNRRAESRTANAHASSEEFKALKEYNDFLQQRLIEKEQRFEEQTQLVRRLNQEVIDLTKSIAEVEVVLARKRCDDEKCPFREPPTAFSQSPNGLTKEEYHKQKRQTQ